MNTDESREYLIARSKPEYHSYVEKRLAGDFATVIAKKIESLEAENKRLKQDIKDLENDCADYYYSG